MVNNNPTNEIYKKIANWLRDYHSSNVSEKEKKRLKALIVSYMYPVVKHLARTIARRATDPIEDLVQAGFIGLLKAIDKYDEDKNDNFRVYAGYLIIGEIKHFIRDNLNTIRVPRYIQELSIRIHNFTQTLTYDELELLTSNDVANALNVSPKVINYTMEVDRRKETLSLEDVFGFDNKTLNYEEVLFDTNYKDQVVYNDVRIIFEKVIKKLPPEHRVLVEMFYNQDMSKKEIAEAFVMTPMAVSRRMKQAFELLAQLMSEESEMILSDEELDEE